MPLAQKATENLTTKDGHTPGHRHCPVCAQAQTRSQMDSHQFRNYLFSVAADKWLAAKNAGISPKQRLSYSQNIAKLAEFFGEMHLFEIGINNVNAYQAERRQTVGASWLNHELGTLGQILKVAGEWERIKPFYRPLPQPESIGMVLEPQEEAYLFRLAKSKPRWLVCFCASLVSNGTGAGPGEIRHLRLRDVDMEHDIIEIHEGTKNNFRKRILPLVGDSKWAMQQLLDRYHDMLRSFKLEPSPSHCILYHRAHKRGAVPDPTLPMGSWRKAWESLIKAFAQRYPHLSGFRRYDLRHNAATKMLENGVPERVVEEMLGHRINSRTKDRYSHIRLEPKLAAAKALNAGHVRPSTKTVNGPNLVVMEATRERSPWR